MSAEKSASSYSGSAKSTPDRLCSSTSGIEPVIRVDGGIAGRSPVMLNRASAVAHGVRHRRLRARAAVAAAPAGAADAAAPAAAAAGAATAAAPAAARCQERERVGVVGDELEDLAVDLGRLVARLVLDVDARELLEHADGLRLLIERLERLREQPERLDVARIGLEARLQLLQRAARIVATQVQARELAVERVVRRAMPQQALGDLDEVVLPALAPQLLARRRELVRRVVDEPLLRVQLGELDARGDVLGVEIDELLDRLERFLRVAFAMEVRGDGLEVLHRIAHQAELAIQLGELEDDVDEARVELEDLLVDRDGFQEEALLVIEARDLLIGVDRVLLRALLRVEVADLEPHADVLRILLDDPQVLLHRFVDLSLVDKLPGRIHDLVFVEGHALRTRCDASQRGVRTAGHRDTAVCPVHHLTRVRPSEGRVKEIHERIPTLTRVDRAHRITSYSTRG